MTVFALLGAFGAGAALLPSSVTGSGSAAETAEAAAAAVAPGAGGGVPGASTPAAPAPSPSAPPPSSAAPSPKASATPKKAPTSKAATAKPKVTRTTSRPAAPQVAPGLEGQENEVIRLSNIERDKAGCGDVKLNTRLRTAMRLHNQELGERGNLYISHVSADGRSFVDRAKEQGYNAPGGENVARGQQNAQDVMNSWMNSEGHRANILNCDFKAIGVGAVKAKDGSIVWGQIFGRE